MKGKYLLSALTFVLVIACITTSCGQSKETATVSTSGLQQNVSVSWAEGAENLKGLFYIADVVAVGEIGKVLEKREVLLGEPRWGKEFLYQTDYDFIIEADLKGDVKNNSLLIRQTGQIGKLELKDDPLFNTGDHYVLFLREFEPGKYNIIGGPQGRFKVTDNGIYSMNYIYPENNIQLPGALQVDGVSKGEFLQSLTD